MEKILRTRLTTALVLAVVFVSGVLLGLAADRSLGAAPPAEPSMADSRRGGEGARRTPMYEQVGPSETQKTLIDSIVKEYRGKMRDLHAEFRAAYDPRYQDLIAETRAAIKNILTAEQGQQYDSLLVDYDRRRAERNTRERGEGRGR